MSVGVGVLWAIAIFYSGILAGGVVTISLAMIPALRAFDPDTDFRVNRIFNPLPARYMPWACAISAVAGLAVLLLDDELDATTQTLIVVALASTLAVIAISLGNRRINPPAEREQHPEEYARIQRYWDLGHWARSAGCVAILACYVVAALLERDGSAGVAEALVVASVVFAALIAGGLVVVLMSLVPTMHLAGEDLGIQVHLGFDRYVDYHLPVFAVTSLVAGLGALVLDDERNAAATVLLVAGLLLALAVPVISHFFNRPMNARLREAGGWPQYAMMRRRWDRLHQTRTAAGVVAFLCLLAVLLLR